jgi:hypothetical protein
VAGAEQLPTGPIDPFSILENSAFCHVHGTAGPDTTFLPSADDIARLTGGVVEERERDPAPESARPA